MQNEYEMLTQYRKVILENGLRQEYQHFIKRIVHIQYLTSEGEFSHLKFIVHLKKKRE